MAYTFSLLPPSPPWLTINPATGAIIANAATMPPAGHIGQVRIQCTDGVNTTVIASPVSLQPAYIVAVDYRETKSIDWRISLRSGARVQLPAAPSTNTWKTRLTSGSNAVTPPPATPATNDWRTAITSGSGDELSTGSGGGGS
jgi:hypothetical protein